MTGLASGRSEEIDPFEPVYSPKKIEFWLAHFEELVTLVQSGKSSAHIAEHLNREWFLLQARLRYCLCKEEHDADTLAVDPACTHSPSGGTFRQGPETALCILADLRRAADRLPPNWVATQRIWAEQFFDERLIARRRLVAHRVGAYEREPVFARTVAIRRMARELGWGAQATPVDSLTV
jgi:hypothetical protein